MQNTAGTEALSIDTKKSYGSFLDLILIMLLSLTLTCILVSLHNKENLTEYVIPSECKYIYTDIKSTLSYTFKNKLRDIITLLISMVFSTSIACKPYTVAVTVYKGFYCGTVIANAISASHGKTLTYKHILFLVFLLVSTVIIIKYLSICTSYFKCFLVYHQRRSNKNIIKLFIKLFLQFTSFSGALCILKVAELLIYST